MHLPIQAPFVLALVLILTFLKSFHPEQPEFYSFNLPILIVFLLTKNTPFGP